MATKSISREEEDQFNFLIHLANKLGATDAKVVTSDKIVVEDRVALKCRTGCPTYGHKLVCPPFAPTPEEFRKILKEYETVLMVKFKAEAETEEDVGRSLLKNRYSPDTPQDVKDKTNSFFKSWRKDIRQTLLKMLELEKTAFNRGYPLALALSSGSCILCKKCNIQGTCVHPSMARYSAEALGVNVKETLKNIGMPMKFPFEKSPEGFGLLLIE